MPLMKPTGWSSVTKKLITGITGLGLTLFVVIHLLGNLLLLVGREEFNAYAYLLEHRLLHGWFVYVAETGLVVMLVLHIISTVSVRLRGREVRGTPYYKVAVVGGMSRKSVASRSMLVTGSVIMVFLVIHIKMFKFGPAEMIDVVEGIHYRDLYTLVVKTFKVWWIALSYTAVMLMVGVHLRHGIWSGIHSMGASNPKFLPAIYIGGIVTAVVLAIGYVLLPISIWLFFDDPTVTGGV